MGIQGRIYNVLGIVVPAELVERDKLYRVSGKIVATHRDFIDSADFSDGSFFSYRSGDPELCVRILGHTQSMGSRHFDESDIEGRSGKALVGYAVANESNWAHATELPPQEEIDASRPRLVGEIRERLGLEVQPAELRLYLLYDWDQRDD